MFLSFSAAGSRTAEFTRFIPASLSLTLLKNQEADFSRSASSTISFIAEASRSVPETLREASLTISTLFGSAKSVEAYRHPFMPLYFDISGVREIESFRLSPFTFNFNIWEPKSEPEPGSGAEIEVKPYLFINFKTYIGNNENILLYIIFIIALIALAATILTLLEEELR